MTDARPADRLYRDNPAWTSMERAVYGDVPVDVPVAESAASR